MSSAAARVLNGGDSEGCASAGSDAEDDVMPGGLALLDFLDSKSCIVFARFGGCAQCSGAPGHDVLHGAWASVEGGWNLGGIQRAEPSTGTGADIDESSPASQALGDDINRAGNLRQGPADGLRDRGVFVVHEAGNFERRHLIEIRSCGKNLFAGKLSEVGLRGTGRDQE